MSAPAPAPRPPWALALDAAALVAFALLFATDGIRLVRAAGGSAGLAALPAAAVGAAGGYALADLVTGICHWLCDRVLHPATPILGRALVRAFREHHDDPLAMTRGGFLSVNGTTALVALPLPAALAALPPPRGAAGVAVHAAGLALALGAVATNQLHAWAHARRVPRAVAGLQRRGVVLSPRAHALHHRGAHDRAYCVTTGWWNPLLDRARVFARLESALAPRARRGSRRRAEAS